MSRLYCVIALGILLLCAASCSNGSERNIIVNRSPFVEEHFPYDPNAIDRIVSATRRFAEANKMDFLIARETLPLGDFNAHAAARNLNLQVIHTGSIDKESVVIFAVARGKPTAADFKTVREFACAVGSLCR